MRVYILLGGFFGKDGWVVSAPFLGLRGQIKKAFPAATVLTYTWDQWVAAGDDIAAHQAAAREDYIVGIGYSGGGWCLTELANRYRSRRIDLAVFYDPSPKWKMKDIATTGIKRALCYHNNSPMMPSLYGMLGGGQVTGRPGQVETVEFSQQHILVQSNQDLHNRTLAAISNLVTEVAP